MQKLNKIIFKTFCVLGILIITNLFTPLPTSAAEPVTETAGGRATTIYNKYFSDNTKNCLGLKGNNKLLDKLCPKLDNAFNANECPSKRKEDYERLKLILNSDNQAIKSFVTFLDNPLSSDNIAYISEECYPVTSDGKTKYNCINRIVCKCTPQHPKVGSNRPAEQLSIKCRRVQFIIASSGQDLAKSYLNLIYRWVASIVGVIAVLYIIINGIIISAAQNDTGQVTAAKERITQCLIAIVVLLTASLILYAVNPTFFAGPQGTPTETSENN